MSPTRKSGSRSKTAAKKAAKTGKKSTQPSKKKAAGKKATGRKPAVKKKAKAPVKKKTAAVKKKSKAPVKKAAAGKQAPAKKTAKAPAARKKTPAGNTPAAKAAAGPTVVRTEPKVSTVQRNTESMERAIKAYTSAMELVHQHQWRPAAQALSDFLAEHGRERELCQRARTWLRKASAEIATDAREPESVEDFCLQATVLANDGRHKEAAKLLEMALKKRPDSDKVLYLQASTLALMGDRRGALAALARAIEANDQNRIWAANNPDFSDLRDDEEFITLTTREDEEY